METTTTTTTLSPEEIQRLKDQYRFGGRWGSFRSPDTVGPNDFIPEETSLYAFPKK